LNILAVNDGIESYRKYLPGNLSIEYYPTILLLKNDKDMTAVEFNAEEEASKEKIQYEMNFNGFMLFLKA